MKSGSFMDIISVHYKDIITLFKSRQHIVEFDPDLFGDAFIKCTEHFGNNEIDYETAIKYYWVVYVNAVKSSFINNAKNQTISIDDVDDMIQDDECSIYNDIMQMVEDKYGESQMQMYRLHKYHNWSENELASIGIKLDKTLIKDIHKFVKTYGKNLKRSH
jgi:hypothetical protein